jgi:DNA-binding IclR family transcriptional regulator
MVNQAQASSLSSKYHVPALEKGLDILELLSDLAVPQTQADIARALGRNTSEVFRMLDCLEQRGYVLRDSANQYQLSLKLYQLAHTHSPIEKLLEAARDPMRELAQTLRESVHLSILHNQELLVLAEELSPNPIRLSVEVGKSFSALETASGRLLLAHLKENMLAHFFANDSHYLASSKQTQKKLQQLVGQARRNTFLIAESDITIGVKDISVLLAPTHSDINASLTLPLLIFKGKERSLETMLKALQKTAKHISKRLGLDT